jgi:lysophospholipase L1-like esterase
MNEGLEINKIKIILLSGLLLLIPMAGFSVKKKITIYTIGDSTMADKDTVGNPERGWAMALPLFFDSAEVRIENHARNGHSTKSFIDEGRWDAVVEKLESGDCVFIRFGHNDEKQERPSLYATPYGAYTDNLTRFVRETQEKGAFPVLMTSIVRRHFDENGILKNTHGEYLDAVRKLASKLKVPMIDMEMSRNFLVENCTFDQGDDAVVIKSGRNRDAWRLNTPCENIVIRNCKIIKGHVLLGIGSEISGGVRNIYMHDCEASDVHRFFFIKTNHRRGGFIENIYMENVKAGKTQRIFEIDTDVLYQWKNLVPAYETRITRIESIYLKNVACDEADAVYEIKGDARLPVQNVNVENITVGKLNKFIRKSQHAENISEKNIEYKN